MENEAKLVPITCTQSIQKSYRQSRRRPAHLRTKTGCLTCRNRKKKCDETRMQCMNCAKRSLDCVWQSNDMIPHQPKKRSPSTSDYAHTETEIALEMRPNTAQYGAYNTGTDISQQAGTDTRHRALFDSRIPREGSAALLPQTRLLLPNESLHGRSLNIDLPYSPAITRRSRPLFQFLFSTFVPQLVRPTMNGYTSEVLTSRTLALAFQYPFCMHALLACCGAEIPGENPEYLELARFHYSHAVTGLRKMLENGVQQCHWAVTMLSIMMLCIYERSKQKPSPGVSIHLSGAAQLIRLHPQIHRHDDASPGVDQSMYRLARESFIFHVTTSLPFRDDACHFEIESALSLAEEAIRENFHVDTISHPYSPVLGFPPQLFRCIYTVYRLYQTSKFHQASIQLCQRLDKDLCRWDSRLEASSTECSRVDLRTENGNESSPPPTANWESQALHQPTLIGPKLYILGSRVLLQSMAGASLASTDIGAEGLIHQAMRVIRQLQPTTDYYADYYCWPLFALGINLRSPCDRDLLLTQASAFWKATNNPTMRRVIDMLRVYWQSHDELPAE